MLYPVGFQGLTHIHVIIMKFYVNTNCVFLASEQLGDDGVFNNCIDLAVLQLSN